jgi:hypothetical protein
MKFLIYKHIINGKTYVGKTCMTLEKRLKGHIRCAKPSCLFHKEILTGACIQSFLLEDNIPDNRTACLREKYWIEKEESYYHDHPKSGLNMTRGGNAGGSPNQTTRELLRQKSLDNWAKRKHIPRSKEWRENISKGQKAAMTDERRKMFGRSLRKNKPTSAALSQGQKNRRIREFFQKQFAIENAECELF